MQFAIDELNTVFALDDESCIDEDGTLTITSEAIRHAFEEILHSCITKIVFFSDSDFDLNFGIQLEDPFLPDWFEPAWLFYAAQIKTTT